MKMLISAIVACKSCKSLKKPHHAKGMCQACYMKALRKTKAKKYAAKKKAN